MVSLSDLLDEAYLSARALIDYGENLFNPTVRIGVTGLSQAGKTVFITALVNALLKGGRLPVFEAQASGRIAGVKLEPQPDDQIARFDYEGHLAALTEERRWPQSTTDISELRLALRYQDDSVLMRTLTLDIVDYPGEWLLDLPLLDKSYEDWSAEALALSRKNPRAQLAAEWHAHLAGLNPVAEADEQDTLAAARLFTAYLRACRDKRYAMSLLPPGRFLLPGNLAGSPALTFAPLDLPADQSAPSGSLWAMMRRRYDSYRDNVVRPFFREHFARLDRQIVLVDALSALNAGPEALRDLQAALNAILDCFRAGKRSLVSNLFRPRIDRILFAATKADHLHHTSHDRLEAILKRMVNHAIERAQFAGASVDVIALAAVRATREATVERGRDKLPAILGTPIAGEVAHGETFDGESEVATFPGDLPDNPRDMFDADGAFRGLIATDETEADYRFLKFRPPLIAQSVREAQGLPHIRLDRALEFLIGDKLR